MINLSPPPVKEQIKYGRLNVAFVRYLLGFLTVGAVVAIIVAGGGWFIANHRGNLEDDLAKKSLVFDSYANTLKEAEELSATINTISSLLDKEIKFSELLVDIAALIPDGANLDGISLTASKDALRLTATLNSQQLAAVFQKNLAGSELFSVADIISISKGDDDDNTYSGSFSAIFAKDDPKPAATTTTETTEVTP